MGVVSTSATLLRSLTKKRLFLLGSQSVCALSATSWLVDVQHTAQVWEWTWFLAVPLLISQSTSVPRYLSPDSPAHIDNTHTLEMKHQRIHVSDTLATASSWESSGLNVLLEAHFARVNPAESNVSTNCLRIKSNSFIESAPVSKSST
ncbi:hypothetical protein ACLKA6_012029 [Drosophila palustris]